MEDFCRNWTEKMFESQITSMLLQELAQVVL